MKETSNNENLQQVIEDLERFALDNDYTQFSLKKFESQLSNRNEKWNDLLNILFNRKR